MEPARRPHFRFSLSDRKLSVVASGACWYENAVAGVFAMSYSIEKQIEEWVEQQGFVDLPGNGKPLNLDEYFRCPEDLRLGYSILRNAGCAPEEVDQIREIARLEDEMRECNNPAARARLQAELNEARVRLNLKLETWRSRRRG